MNIQKVFKNASSKWSMLGLIAQDGRVICRQGEQPWPISLLTVMEGRCGRGHRRTVANQDDNPNDIIVCRTCGERIVKNVQPDPDK